MKLKDISKYLAAAAVFTTFISGLVFESLRNQIIWNWYSNSDSLTLPTIINELSLDVSQFKGWQFPRSPFFFPDGLAYYILNFLRLDYLLYPALAIVPSIMIFIFLGAKIAANFKKVMLRELLLTTATIFTVLFLLITNVHTTNWVAKYFFTAGNHFTYAVYSTLVLYLFIRNIKDNNLAISILGFVITFLCSLSNKAYVSYLAPSLIVILLTSLLFKKENWLSYGIIRKSSLLQVSAMGAGVYCQNFINRQPEANISLNLKTFLGRNLREFQDVLSLIKTSLHALLFVLLLVLIIVWMTKSLLREQVFKNSEKFYEPRNLMQLGLLISVLANPIFSAFAWENIDSSRYLMIALFSPLLLLPKMLSNLGMLRRIEYGFIAIIIFLLGLLSLNGALSIEDQINKSVNPILVEADCIKENGGEIGLAGYWTAKRLTYLSNTEIKLVQLTPWPTTKENLLFVWGSNANDFMYKYAPRSSVNYVIVNDLERETLKLAFGEPSRNVLCGSLEIWFYPSNFSLLSQIARGNLDIFSDALMSYQRVIIPAAVFNTQIGSYVTDKIVLNEDVSQPGFALFGGYLELEPGNYRFTLSGKAGPPSRVTADSATFEVSKDFGKSLLNKVSMDTKGSRFSVALEIKVEQRSILEPRVYLKEKHSILEINHLQIDKR